MQRTVTTSCDIKYSANVLVPISKTPAISEGILDWWLMGRMFTRQTFFFLCPANPAYRQGKLSKREYVIHSLLRFVD